MNVDLQFSDHGSVWLMKPLTEAGREWIAEHIPAEAPRLGDAVSIEPRFVEYVAMGAMGDGLNCSNT